MRRHSLLGSKSRIISVIFIYIHYCSRVSPGANYVVLGAEEIHKRKREEMILLDKEENGVG